MTSKNARRIVKGKENVAINVPTNVSNAQLSANLAFLRWKSSCNLADMS
jgi:hypothetical protein